MPSYVVDTHSLVWFIAEDDRLSRRVARLLAQAETADVQVLVPTIVLAEITYIAEKRRVKVAVAEVLARIESGDGFAIVPFDLAVLRSMLQLPIKWEMHDRIIAATACHYKAKVITKDRVLRGSSEVETVW